MKTHCARLGDVAEVFAGGSAPQDPQSFSVTGLPFVRAGSLAKLRNGGNENSLEKLSDAVAREHRLRLFPEGTVVFAKSGMSATKGLVYKLRQPSYVVNHLAAIVSGTRLDPTYLAHYLRFDSPTKLVQDAAYPSIRLSDISNIDVPLPLLSEQRRIVTVLDKADELRAKRRAALEQLNGLTQSIFLEMFGNPLSVNSSKMQASVKSVTKRITYGFTSPMKHVDSGIPILTAKNIRDGAIDFSTAHYADETEFAALTAKCKPQPGDVLVTKDGTIGRCAVVDVTFPICINQSVALIQPDHEKVLPSYLLGYLLTEPVQRVMRGMSKGNALVHLQITELAELPIPLPSLDEQAVFQRRTAPVGKTKILQSKSHRQMDSLFRSLQHQAFNGTL